MVVFYCPNCWARVREDEKICPECNSEIESFDHHTYYEKLVKALNHPERSTRIRAAYILGALKDPRAVKPFAEIVKKAGEIKDIFFIEMIAHSLGNIDGEEALSVLMRLMDHPSFLVRRAALNSLRNFREEEAIKVIKKALKDKSSNVQELAQKILQTHYNRHI